MADAKQAKKDKKAELKAALKEETKELKIWFQYVVGIIVVLGGFSAGTCIGWSSPAAGLLKKHDINDTEFAWVSSSFALGGAVVQFPVMGLIQCAGLKWTIIIAHAVVIVGWVVMSISFNFYAQVAGRFICGMAAGFCVACPTYIGESTFKTHRGTIGVFFQLFITGGILWAYIFGIFKNLILLNIACSACGVAGIVLMILFVPESPYLLLKKKKNEKFEKIMRRLRGSKFDYSKEKAEMQAAIDTKSSIKEGFRQSVNLKAFGVLLGLHILQQLSGINAILYHAHSIFEKSNTGISGDLSVIIVGVAQVLFCIVAAVAVDRAGRIMLFIISLAVMCLCLAMTGVFFGVSASMQVTLALVPTIALVVYICGFSLGAGPLPWAMLGEYLPNSVKGIMSTIISCVNWALAFCMSWAMPFLMQNLPASVIFYGFAVVCGLGIFYILLFVVETNQKNFDQIQAEIESHKPGDLFKKKKAEN